MTVTVGAKRVIADTTRYLAFPTAAYLDGLLIASWADKSGHFTLDAETWIAHSRDGGRTWGNARLLTEREAAPAGMATHPTAPHRWAVLEWAQQPYRGWVRTSPDGDFWSEKKPVTWAGSSWKFPCSLTWLHDGTQWGRMIVTCYGGDGIGVSESRDGGATWQHLPSPTDVTVFGDGTGESETTITPTASGRWLMLTRQDKVGGRVVWARFSDDEGQTWTPKQLAFASGGLPSCTLLPDGTLVATVRDDTPDGTPESWALATSTDDGQTWQTQQIGDDWMMYGQVAATYPGAAVLVGASQVRAVQTDSDVWARPLSVQSRSASRLLQGRRSVTEQWLLGSFVTGEVKAVLPVEDGSSWQSDIAGSNITAQLSLTSTSETLVQHVIPWRDYLAVVVDDQIMAAGPIMSDAWDADAGRWILRAKGAEAWTERRMILPARARQDGVWFQMHDAAKKEPAAWAHMKWSGMTWPEIAAAVMRSALSWKGITPWAVSAPNVKVPNPSPHGAKTEFELDGMDFVTVASMLGDMERSDAGVEWQLQPRWQAGDPSSDVIEWIFRTGSPLITSGRLATWAHDRVAGLRTARDGSKLTTLLHMTGGRQADTPVAVTRGGAGSTILLETLDSTRGHIDTAKRLREIAGESLNYQGRPSLDYEFEVPMEQSGLWAPGDFALLMGDPQARLEWQARTPHLPAETRLRITGRSAQAGSQLITVHTQYLAPEDDNAWLQAS